VDVATAGRDRASAVDRRTDLCKSAPMPTAVRDGVELHYELATGHATPLVFVHGWCCDHTYFAPQVEHFANAGHTVVAIDLRGHGASDAPVQAYSMAVFADDLAWLIGELGLDDPVIVGHSMGGVVAFELAIEHPDAAAAIVMIDAPAVRPAASRAALPTFLEALRRSEFRDALRHYVSTVLFLPTADDHDRCAQILARMPETPQHVMIAAIEGMRDFDPARALGRLRLPALYLAADDTPLTDLPRLRQLLPNLQFGQTVGSGHFCQLEVPDQVNPMLERFLTILPALTGS
jgi:pimeloyl-ACP methyl ester carboxylesterase